MDIISDHLNNVINHFSLDVEFGKSLEYFLSFLSSLKIDHIFIGSCAIQSYYRYLKRIPNDIDIVIHERDIPIINTASIGNKYLRFEEHRVANKLHYKNSVYLHLIPENMRQVDKIKQTVFATINIFFKDRTTVNEVSMLNYHNKIRIRVPILEYIYCMNLFTQLNTNTVNDIIALLEDYDLDTSLVDEFVSKCEIMKPVLESRSKNLRKILDNYRPDLAPKAILIK